MFKAMDYRIGFKYKVSQSCSQKLRILHTTILDNASDAVANFSSQDGTSREIMRTSIATIIDCLHILSSVNELARIEFCTKLLDDFVNNAGEIHNAVAWKKESDRLQQWVGDINVNSHLPAGFAEPVVFIITKVCQAAFDKNRSTPQDREDLCEGVSLCIDNLGWRSDDEGD